MGISELSGKLDASGIVQTLLDDIVSPTQDINDTSSPATGDQLSTAVSVSADVDTSPLSTSIGGIAGQMTDLLGSLPGAQDVIQPLETAIVLAEQLSAGNPLTQIQTLIDRLSTELGTPQGGDFLGVLLRFGNLLKDAPELRGFIELVNTAFRSSGLSFEPAQTVQGMLPAAAEGIRAIGGLMTLETILSEGERLTDIMAKQIDARRIETATLALRAHFESTAAAVDGFAVDAGSATPEAIENTVTAVRSCGAVFLDMERLLAQSLGFGEATLVHFDMAHMKTEVDHALSLLSEVDASAIAQVLQSLLDRIQPIFNVDLEEAAAEGLDDLITQLENKTADISDSINALDLSDITDPITTGIGAVTGVIGDFSNIIDQVTSAIRTALESVRQLVAALPFDQIATAVQTVLEPVSLAMGAIQSLLDGIQSALEFAAETVTLALGKVEEAIETFAETVDTLFGEAATFVESLHLDQVIGQVADQINAFADILAKAQMKPYFDTASDVIDTTADVIDALPLDLLPDSMKSDLDTACAPVRAIDVPAVKDEVTGWFQIEDGKFKLRGPLEDALSDLQEDYDNFITIVESADPRKHVDKINLEMDKIRNKIVALLPEINLQPVRDAIDRVKGALESFDLAEQLAPVNEVFDQIIEAIDEYSPTQFIQPLEDRVAEAREALTSAVKLDEWTPTLEDLSNRAKGLMDRIDPAQLEPIIKRALDEITKLLARGDQVNLFGALGNVVSSMLSGSGLKIRPGAFDMVMGWLSGNTGGDALEAKGGRIHQFVATTKDSVNSIDVEALSIALTANVAAMQSTVSSLEEGSEARVQLSAALNRLTIETRLAALSSNRTRFLTALEDTEVQAGNLAQTGLSQVGVTIAGLQSAFSPGAIVVDFFKALLAKMGISSFEGGFVGVMERVFSSITPERLAGILTPIFEAVHGRISDLIDTVVDPLKQGIEDLEGVVNAITLAPFIEAIDGVVTELKDQIQLLSPSHLLGPTLDAFDALKADLMAFDPLAPIDGLLKDFEDAINNIRDSLDANRLLSGPIRIYDEILNALKALSLDNLLEPVLDQLDNLAEQIDTGLDTTVESLEHLQDALPAPGGGSSGSASVSVG
ncbi:MAG: hypothetical protein GY847_09120 [Proteobacteria bacterium]|nr:hypothetical protein [Pseudomonadota bacterium]